jgi:hypothetical protein
MMNQYGLPRDIPEPIRRQVRQECGFGCVVCGFAIIQYHHFEPPFEQAVIHDPNGIALLCGHCHDLARSCWSKEKVARARRHPRTFADRCTRDSFELNHPFDLCLGDNRITDVRCIVRYGASEWFTIKSPDAVNAPAQLNTKVFFADRRIGVGDQR